jgi:hypothetical protein
VGVELLGDKVGVKRVEDEAVGVESEAQGVELLEDKVGVEGVESEAVGVELLGDKVGVERVEGEAVGVEGETVGVESEAVGVELLGDKVGVEGVKVRGLGGVKRSFEEGGESVSCEGWQGGEAKKYGAHYTHARTTETGAGIGNQHVPCQSHAQPRSR